MASRTDITGERLLEALTWDWQDVESLRLLLIPTVAPGKALRTYQARTKPKKGGPLSRALTAEDEQIRSGARAIVNDRIASAVSGGRAEFNEDRSMIRFRDRRQAHIEGDACPTCQRPFEQPARESTSPTPETKPVVIYPDFKVWAEHRIRTTQEQGAVR